MQVFVIALLVSFVFRKDYDVSDYEEMFGKMDKSPEKCDLPAGWYQPLIVYKQYHNIICYKVIFNTNYAL